MTFALGAFGVVWAARRASPRAIFIGTASCMAAAFLVFRGLVAPALDPWLSHSDIAAYLEREREVATPLVAVGFDPAGASLLLNRTIPRVAEDPLKLSDASPRSVLLEYDERRQLAPEVFARRGLHLAALFRIGHRRIAVTRTHPVPQASLYRQPAAPPWIGGRGVERSSWKAIQQASWGQWFVMAGTILALLSLCMPNGRQGQMPVGDDGAGRKELQRQR